MKYNMGLTDEWNSIVDAWNTGIEIITSIGQMDEVIIMVITIVVFLTIFIFVGIPIITMLFKYYAYRKLTGKAKKKKVKKKEEKREKGNIYD